MPGSGQSTSPGAGGGCLWAPHTSAACSGTVRAKQSPAGRTFVGRQQGNALLNLLNSRLCQKEEEGRRKEPPQPHQQLGEGHLWACRRRWGRNTPSASPLCLEISTRMSLPSRRVTKRFLFCPSVTTGTCPLPKRSITNPQSYTATHMARRPGPSRCNAPRETGKPKGLKLWRMIAADAGCGRAAGWFAAGQRDAEGQQHNYCQSPPRCRKSRVRKRVGPFMRSQVRLIGVTVWI